MSRLNIAAELSDYQNKRVPEASIQKLQEKGYFKMFIPQSLGGLELGLTDATQLLVETAAIHGSLGWIHNLGAGANYFCGFFDPVTAEELFRATEVITSGSGFANGSFELSKNKYAINGTWSKCSGASFASLFTLNAINSEGKQQSFIVPAEKVKVTPDWQSFGLQASASDSITLNNVEVPETYTFEIGKVKSFQNYLIYHTPFELFARVCLSATFEGLVDGLLQSLKNAPQKQRESYSQSIKEIRSDLNGLHLKRDALIAKSEEFLISTNTVPYSFVKDVANNMGNAHFKIYQKISKLYWHSGISISETSSLSHWVFRDIMTAVQHYMLKPIR